MPKLKLLSIHLTQNQIYQIREWVTENGYPEGCGLQDKHFYLITQPIIKDWEKRLDVILLNEKQGRELRKVFKKMKLIKEE